MAKYESQVKQVYAPQSAVYAKLSDLRSLEVIKERINEPLVQQQIPADKLEQVRDTISKMNFDADTVSGPAGPIGNLSIKIIEREPEKCIKYTSLQSPVNFTLWIQILPTSTTTSKLRVTIDADLNFFMRQVIGKKLEEGVDKFADMLAMIPY